MSAMYCKRHACKTQCVENFLVALVAVEGCESVLTGTLVGNNSVMGGDCQLAGEKPRQMSRKQCCLRCKSRKCHGVTVKLVTGCYFCSISGFLNQNFKWKFKGTLFCFAFREILSLHHISRVNVPHPCSKTKYFFSIRQCLF